MSGLDSPADAIDLVKQYLLNLQNKLCAQFEAMDGKARFAEDTWTRAEGGGGI